MARSAPGLEARGVRRRTSQRNDRLDAPWRIRQNSAYRPAHPFSSCHASSKSPLPKMRRSVHFVHPAPLVASVPLVAPGLFLTSVHPVHSVHLVHPVPFVLEKGFPQPCKCIESEMRHLNEAMSPAGLEKLEHELWAIFPLGWGLGAAA